MADIEAVYGVMANTRGLSGASVIPHVLRRMRTPLITLIGAYSVAVLGLVLIPGRTAEGEVHHPSFFDAFYFISYTSTTIGYGELPHSFTGAQRLWVVFCIYLVVIAWFYAIGALIALVRDPDFQQAVTWNRFRRNVWRLTEPFYLVCGYGDTGSQLVGELTARGSRVVVIDSNAPRIGELSMADLRSYVPSLCCDANLTDNLVAAGLGHPRCEALLAVTDSDHANVHVAITAKLLDPSLKVIARAENAETRANMASFGTDHVINPFDTFAGGMALAIQTPKTHRLYEWVSAKPVVPLTSGTLPPRGTWIICGYGRMGQTVHERLRRIGIDMIVVAEEEPEEFVPEAYVHGKGTEAETLRRAGIDQAAGVIAATGDDADNLSIMLTARELNPEIFLIGRQNDPKNGSIFMAAKLDMIMEPSSIIALRMLRLLTTPLLPDFLRRIRQYDDDRVGELLESLQALTGGEHPEIWSQPLNEDETPALAAMLDTGASVTVGTICRSPLDLEQRLAVAVLMIRRPGEEPLLLPSDETRLAPRDELLLVGRHGEVSRLTWTLSNANALHYVRHGEHLPYGTAWRWLVARRRSRAAAGGVR